MFPALAILPKELTISSGPALDGAVRWISKNFYAYIKPVRDWVTLLLLLPLRDFYLWLPWTMVIGLIGLLGWRLGGSAPCHPALSRSPVFMLVTGFWVPLMLTIYLVTGATIHQHPDRHSLGRLGLAQRARCARRHGGRATRCRRFRASSTSFRSSCC